MAIAGCLRLNIEGLKNCGCKAATSGRGFTSHLSLFQVHSSTSSADESCFWLEFVIDENLQKRDLVEPLLQEATELRSIFLASRKTARKTRSPEGHDN